MRKILLIVLFIIPTLISKAQVTSLNETFNAFCNAIGENYPTYWTQSNTVTAWTCGPTAGRGLTPSTTSPGIECNNTIGSTDYVDTAWLITPQLNLSFYTGNIYLQFDTKYFNAGSRLSLLVSGNYSAGWPPDTVINGHTWDDLTSVTTPVLDNTGSATWVTHVVDLTSYKATPMYVAFRYTANGTGSSTWIIDNVMTTQTPVGVPVIQDQPLSLNIVGSNTRQVTLSYCTPVAAKYQLLLYDILGHVVYKDVINAQQGPHTYIIDGLDLHEGMYLVKMENGAAYCTAKVMVK